MEERPKVGFGVYIIKGGKVLLGKRKNAHGDGSWCAPGGHLEFNETLKEGAEREVMEEAGIKIKNLIKGTYTNDVFEKEGKHYITLHLLCEFDSGDVKVMEPEKCERWDWFEWDNLPEPLFLPLQNSLKENYDPIKDYYSKR